MTSPKDEYIEVNGHTYKLWLNEKEIINGVIELAAWLDNKFRLANSLPPVLMEVQTGGKYLLVDVHRKLSIDVHIDAVGITSYPDIEKQVEPRITSLWRSNVKGRDIVLVEDIIDSGATTQYLKKELEAAGAKSVTIVALIARNHSTKGMGTYDHVCFTYNGDEWLYGYGLDDGQLGRQLTNVYFKVSK